MNYLKFVPRANCETYSMLLWLKMTLYYSEYFIICFILHWLLCFMGPLLAYTMVLGAGVRHSAHGKGHEEGGLT